MIPTYLHEKLVVLRIIGKELKTKSVDVILIWMKKFTSLIEFDLSGCQINKEDVKRIGEELKDKTIKRFRFCDTKDHDYNFKPEFNSDYCVNNDIQLI